MIVAYQDLHADVIFCARCALAQETPEDMASFIADDLVEPLTMLAARGRMCWNCSRVIGKEDDAR